MTQTMELKDECGNIDLCEVEINGTRVIRVIKRMRTNIPSEMEDRSYSIQYQHACGYRD